MKSTDPISRPPTDDTIRRMLRGARTIAVVGLSTDPEKPSAVVAAYLQQAGYCIVPVHPTAPALLGEKAYPDLASIPFPVDLVDVFRPAAECPEIARQAAAIRAKALWLQVGIVSTEAAEIAAQAGLDFVMDRCTKIEHARLHPHA